MSTGTTTPSAAGVVRDYLEAIAGRQDLEPFLAPDITFGLAADEHPLRGASEVTRAVRHHYEQEFDARPEVVRLVADERSAVAELLFVGRHVGRYAGLPATGRVVRVPLAMAFDVEDAVIVAIRLYYSPEGVLAQLRG
ncbi:ester cyclase [Amnibacterium sp. CER49]|uniref:nuclear transport factor 2 family protein n=1 Tax=Amnibacterium sp. CER49 TaxID=3039161 RepID=UPI00244D502B|nr:ester cyclase [Amnibacterium sp. CER49]MDH2443458.1 ester cyclase [Amnibacterium sp. CER49]